MSYQPRTRLTRKTFIEPPEDAVTPDLSPYNEVEVIGRSPVARTVRSEEWGGQQGDEYSIKPLAGFGEVIDTVQGILERDYDVTYVPELTEAEREVVRITDAGPTPEDRFRADEDGESTGEREQTPFATDVS